MVKVAAVQLEAVLADVDANLAACERLATQAGEAGAKIIALPEFFTTGIGFDERLAYTALPIDGPATKLLTSLAARFEAMVGGSFMCADTDGHVRNKYVLAGPDGVIGVHDKDLPTMWENAFYVGGHDDGVIDAGTHTIGAAVCWELMRTQTVRRLRERVDLVMAGSGWWSVPPWMPGYRRWERDNEATARTAAATFARFVGAPVIHAAHAGTLECAMPWMPMRYRGHFEGSALITDADGTVLAERSRHDGEGIVLADITLGRQQPSLTPPPTFWLHRRGPVAAFAWNFQRLHGRRWYRNNVRAS
ncbi:carbon-nitrogen hydrolase family protein [Planosporangium flavigriseum]|uniref:CN hydrolase domain-containing protein n=1 Tax=Planosporangium flavigriseum TaxID=373681 RepID=A0A8J3PJE1_9ACTN|nr:carbon-nitrogen hydrolase family protein [Planosporangium flavigriseum]NJC65101.1 carbon-nitrogen hydrolase family protein [Planosporangium flavigriseum]GIG71717.1 hypothetical protein Pfl04_01210 [Planosporangium flavigriseum]